MIKTSGMISSGNLLGVTANRNIAAFSIALKIPFVLNLILKTNNFKIKIVGLVITTLAITALSMIQSRSIISRSWINYNSIFNYSIHILQNFQ